MDKNGKVKTSRHANVAQTQRPPQGLPRCLGIAIKGITTGRDFANMMSALMTDLIEGKISPGIGNATCNAGGKLLKVVEMQAKYGQAGVGSAEKTLILTSGIQPVPALGAGA